LQVIEGFVAFELGVAHGFRLITHTAHEFATALEHQMRLEEFVQNAPELHAQVREVGGYRHANGQESIRLKDGTRIAFKARTRAGGRGFSGDLLVWDEAMEISEATVGAQKPALRASKACTGRRRFMRGRRSTRPSTRTVLRSPGLRERGIAREPKVSWVEYSAPFEHPDEMTVDDMNDRRHWHAANPSMVDGLVTEETMEDELRTIAVRTAAVELLGVGDWPRTDGGIDRRIDLGAWDALENAESQLLPPYSLAFDVSPDRKTAIALSGRNEAGKFHVEIQEFREGTKWAAAWIAARWQRSGHEIYSIAADGAGPAGSLRVELEELGVPVDWINAGQLGEMCGHLVDVVAEGRP
jgi:hypothetical protein